MCPGSYVCDGSHNCNMEGATLIKKIHLITESCAMCGTASTEGGARIEITGHQHACTTNGLDHPDQMDYVTRHEAIFESQTDAEMMGQCNNVSCRLIQPF